MTRLLWLSVAMAIAISAQCTMAQEAEALVQQGRDAEGQSEAPVVRCRICGAAVARKR